MIDKNIKHFRKAKGMSQEEMAVKLNVVRQTVSKWENGLSVPDADVLIRMAELLNVSVSQLLGIEAKDQSDKDLSEELSKLNEQLAKKTQKEKVLLQANKKRGLIVAFSFIAMLIALLVKNEIVSILLVSLCVFTMLIVFYRNLGQFTRNYTQTVKRAADNKRRYAPGWVHSTCLLRGFPKGAAPHLAHDFAEQSVVCYTLCRRCPENTVAAGEGKGI